jgi:hypothetical protein
MKTLIIDFIITLGKKTAAATVYRWGRFSLKKFKWHGG